VLHDPKDPEVGQVTGGGSQLAAVHPDRAPVPPATLRGGCPRPIFPSTDKGEGYVRVR